MKNLSTSTFLMALIASETDLARRRAINPDVLRPEGEPETRACPDCQGTVGDDGYCVECGRFAASVGFERRFVTRTGNLDKIDLAWDEVVLVDHVEQSWSGQCYAHCRVLGEPQTFSRWFTRQLLGSAEYGETEELFREDEGPADRGWIEGELDLNRLMDMPVKLPDTNWEHLKHLAAVQDSRVEKVLADVAEFEAAGNIRMLTEVARWARRMSFAGIQRQFPAAGASERVRNQGKLVDRTGKPVDRTGLTYGRYARVMNAVTQAAARVNGVAPESLDKPFGLLPLKEFPATDPTTPEVEGEDILDHGARVGEFCIDVERWVPASEPSFKVTGTWKSSAYVPTPRGIQTYRDPEFAFGPAALR